MLEELEIHDLGPIRRAMLEPSAGMTAITGETGAGKSMLLNAIRLISGGQSDVARISAGADATWVQGVFDVTGNESARTAVRQTGVGDDDGELFLTRSIPASGRSRAMLNGRGVPKGVLAGIAEELVTIHGQMDQLRIASPSRQRDYLDAYAGNDAARADYAGAWRALRDMDDRLSRLEGQLASANQRLDYLKDATSRIDRVDPHHGEDEELRAKRDRAQHAEAIARGIGEALGALDPGRMDFDGGEAQGVVQLLGRAATALRGIGLGGAFDQSADQLEAMTDDISDMVVTLSGQLDDEDEGVDLDALNGRIHDLDELTRRWGPTLDDVIAWREQARLELEDLDASPDRIEALRRERAKLAAAAVRSAKALHASRLAAGKALAVTVNEELGGLAMAGAELRIEVKARIATKSQDPASALDAHGCDDVALLFAAFPGAPWLPMGKSASGGELSRLMLALELAMAERSDRDCETGAAPSMTCIFDEVDAGVGGKSAVRLGRRLAALAQSNQVIVVTHLAQVASWADKQIVVSKAYGDSRDGGVATEVHEVSGEDRVAEIARMLAGSESAASLDHARELLESSRTVS